MRKTVLRMNHTMLRKSKPIESVVSRAITLDEAEHDGE